MELWIKSVNNLILIKPDFIFAEPVEAKKNTAWKIRAKYGINEYTLGYYEDTKRALEVLDEIQNIINNDGVENEEYDKTSGCYYAVKKNVYQMPSE